MPEEDEERFTDEDMEDVVEPVRSIARAFGRAVSASLHFEQSGIEGSALDKFWEEVADELCWFVKKQEEDQ